MRIGVAVSGLFAVFLLSCSFPVSQEMQLEIIPRPAKVTAQRGRFVLDENTFVHCSPRVADYADLLSSLVRHIGGYDLKKGTGKGRIILKVDTAFAGKGREAYRLEISGRAVVLSASDVAGLFYGVQTFGQLLSDGRFYHTGKKKWILPAMIIEDYPAFPYRGLHLDVSRHFFPKEFVMKCLDLMAAYKLNRLHWHLTDAQGWRIEIKKYPELTEKGAWRTRKDCMAWWQGDRRYASRETEGAYGGFYTQKEIREVVDYAAARHITVIPEIEMPGHSEEVTGVYPQLGCYGQPYRSGEFCIGNEETFRFVEDVLTEVMALFPSEYIHVGGDEASVAAWKKCRKCQKRMKELHLKDERELQSYMIGRVQQFLNSKGRKLIGWDEILEGGLAPGATVMSWRGETGGIRAARMGHDVIMTPGEYCYFDHYQADPRTQPPAIGGFLPYLKVYSYHPVPEELTAEEAGHILGAQANVWTEYIPTPRHAEYMIFPRLLSLAEVVWSPRDRRETEDFKRRIAHHIGLLKAAGVNVFALSDRIDLLTETDTLQRRMKVSFSSEKYRPEIHFVLNEGEEQLYRTPFYITDSARVRAFIVEDGKRGGEMLDTRLDYHRGIGKNVAYTFCYSTSYPAAGTGTLTDGKRGGLTYGDGCWQGFLNDIEVTMDMDSICDLGYVSAGFMQLTGPGVYMPEYVKVSVSEDGRTFRDVARVENIVPSEEKRLVIKDFTVRFQVRGRYVRFFAKRQKGFLFADEIVIY